MLRGNARLTCSPGRSADSDRGDTGVNQDQPDLPAQIPAIDASYDDYIGSGIYDQRYPEPNRRTFRRLRQMLPNAGHFLDFGAGTGRYTIPLIEAGGVTAIAYDISRQACESLARRAAHHVDSGRLVIRHEHRFDTIAGDYRDRFDLVFLGFGVLGHIPGRTNRRNLLQILHTVLKPGGVLLLSVPNARRRFLSEQRAARTQVRAGVLEHGDILYSRRQGEHVIPLYYHLYTKDEICADIRDAGFEIHRVEPESMWPEETVVRHRMIGRVDDLICGFAPSSRSYNILVQGSRGAAS